MSDFHDDDTQFWHDQQDWNRTGELPAIRPAEAGDRTGSHWLGRLARDETGSHRVAAARARRRPGQPIERTRTHGVVRRTAPPVPADASPDGIDDWAPIDHWVEPEVDRAATGVDPRLMRVGALVAAAVLLVPLISALRGDPGDGSIAGESGAVTTTAPPQTLPEPTTTIAVQPTAAVPAPAAFVAPAEDDEDDDEDDEVAVAADTGDAERDEPQCAGTYTVIANDFWNRFPKTSGASVEEWLEANNATHDTPLYVGDELCIPLGATAPAPPATTAPPTTEAPATTAAAVVTAAPPAPAPAPAPTTPPPPPTTAAPAPPPPPPPPTTQASAPVAAGAPSTQALCGSLPTSNGNPAGTPGPAEVEAMIREIWPDDIEVRALCIAKREARLRADLNNYCCYGVFALYFKYVPEDLKRAFGVDEPADLFNARTNIAIAYQIHLRGGWDPWSQTDPGPG